MAEPSGTPQAPTPAESFPASRSVTADVAALTHPGQRPNNEDAYAVFRLGRYVERVSSNLLESDLPARYEDTGHLLMVADGLGGSEGGEVASRMALRTLLESVVRSPKWALKLDDPDTREDEIASLIERTGGYLQKMHAAIRARQEQVSELNEMGTTITTAYMVGADLFIMHVGDSRAYVLRRGHLIRVTRDHTLAQLYADQGLMGQAEVAEHPLRHVLTRAVGAPVEQIDGDTHHREILDGDQLLLCSDGITKVASEEEIAGVLLAAGTSEAACLALVDLALARGAPDNVTLIVSRFAVA